MMSGLYFHIPFCKRICAYCDFHRCADLRLIPSTIEAMHRELDAEANFLHDRKIATIYFGGGTPSLLDPVELQRFIDHAGRLFDTSAVCEITAEMNPDDITAEYISKLRQTDINRISLGVQSFDDKILRFMNRRQSSEDAVKAYGILEEAGVRNISIDLIFGLPQLSLDQWKNTLDKALNISSRGTLPQHVSSYQLSVEPGSMLARLAEKGVWSEASDEVCQEQYSALCEALASAGYHHYEISNFALPGYEAVHNSAYWRHVPYVGLGPGAHGFSPLDASRQWNADDLQAYLDAYRNGDFSAIREGETLTREQLVLEHIMLGLRTSAGLSADYLRAHCEPAAFDRALDSGDLQAVPGSERLRIPESRFFVSDSIISSLV